jgi:hypothetical protein
MSLRQILVATDLTGRSNRALARGLQLEPEALTLLHVVPAGLPPELAEEQRRAAETFLTSCLPDDNSERASKRTRAILIGSAFNTIIAEAISRAADLIVICRCRTASRGKLW